MHEHGIDCWLRKNDCMHARWIPSKEFAGNHSVELIARWFDDSAILSEREIIKLSVKLFT